MNIINVSNLSKTYKIAKRKKGILGSISFLFKPSFRTIKAVDSIDFNIEEGELVGYIGPNGAGKSTTIKMLSGILAPDGGKIIVMGKNPSKNRIDHVKNIGVVFGQRTQLWWDVPVQDSFLLLKDIYKIPNDQFDKNLEQLVSKLGLEELLQMPVRQLSLGQKMRCELAASLLHEPKVLFLDEPTIGLDAVSKLAVRSFIKSLNEEKKTTVILTTHDMDDIEALCKRIILIGKGKILFDGSIDGLRKVLPQEKTLTVDLDKPLITDFGKDVSVENLSYNRYKITFDPTIYPIGDMINQINKAYHMVDLEVANISIEEVIAKLYEVHQI